MPFNQQKNQQSSLCSADGHTTGSPTRLGTGYITWGMVTDTGKDAASTRGGRPAQPRQDLDPYLLTKPTGCQLQIGARQGHLPSASAETEPRAAAAADLQHPLREFREKTLESPLDCKEIQPVHPKGNHLNIHWKDRC